MAIKDTASAASVLIIGSGNMGAALAKGLSGSGFRVAIHDIHSGRMAELADKYKIRTVTEPAAELEDISALIFCVKPQDLSNVTAPLAGKILAKTLVISILAGTPISAVEEALNFKNGVVRAML